SLAFDLPFFVLFRRELASFFVSPLTYVVLFAFGLFAWGTYMVFLGRLIGGPVREPVFALFVLQFLPLLVYQSIPPIITMGLLSEESRTGTLEVMLTAPVDEVSIVLAKFAAAMVTYFVALAPFALVLLAIPLSGGNVFDYRPMLSFFLGLAVT